MRRHLGIGVLAMLATLMGCESQVGVAAVYGGDPAATLPAGPDDDTPPGPPAGPLTLSDFAIQPSPRNVVSCYVTLTTSEPARVAVEVGKDAAYTFRVRDDTLAVAHKVIVFGLHADTAWHLRAVATAPDGRTVASEDRTFTTGPLPPEVPVAKLSVPNTGSAQPGFTLTGVGFGLPWDASSSVAVMYDLQGEVVWYYVHPDGPASIATLVDGGKHVLVAAGTHPLQIDLAGQVVWESPVEPSVENTTWSSWTPNTFHHEFTQLPNGNYAVIRFRLSDHELSDALEEMAPDGTVLWSWSTAAEIEGWGYGTGLVIDLQNDAAYYSSRLLSKILKIDRKTGTGLWYRGSGGSFATDPSAEVPWFADQHDPVLLPSGNLLMFDNGPEERGWSRVVEYALDEKAMTAKVVWQYPKPEAGGIPAEAWYTIGGGSGQRLPNGNTLIAAITGLFGDQEGSCRIFEVDPAGDVVWRIAADRDDAVTYRAERVMPAGYELIAP